MNNINSNNIIPIPTETALFSEDGVIDDQLKWRWWFKLPDSWTTSNIGEKIIGIRSLYLNKNRRKFQFTLELEKYLYITNADGSIIIEDESLNTMTVRITSWLPVEKDLREVYIDIQRQIKGAIIENEKTKTPEQISFHMDEYSATKSDFQMDGVFKEYNNRMSFVEKMYCRPTDDYEPVVKDNTTYMTMCKFKIYDYNEDFKFIFNVMESDEQDLYGNNKNIVPEESVTKLDFYDVWDRRSCKLFSSLASDSNKGYIGNSQIDFSPIKYFKLSSTDKKFYIDFYNSRNINCPSVIPYMYEKDSKHKYKMSEPFVIELQLMQNDKLLYI